MSGEELTGGVQTMFYRPRQAQTGRMWDTWLYFHDGTYYLYYLANCSDKWDNISLATSADGVAWREHGVVLLRREGVEWMGTGSTWKSPHYEQDGRFYVNFSEWRGPRQTIFFAESTDLMHWRMLGDANEFRQDERWYQAEGRWDCIWTIPCPGGGLYGYWTATPKRQGCFGFGRSDDGVTWEALQPPEAPGVGEGEVGAVAAIDDRYYMLFGTGGMMVTLVAERPEGPFHPSAKNYHLLSGHTYFARFFPSPEGLLVNHHSIARDGSVCLGALKCARVDEVGTLRLTWWPGNQRIKDHLLQVPVSLSGGGGGDGIAFLDGCFNAQTGVILEGPKPRGLYIEHDPGAGTAIFIGPDGVAELGSMSQDGGDFECDKRADRQCPFAETGRIRLLLKESMLEVYLEDILLECYSLPSAATGRIGVIPGDGAVDVDDWNAWGNYLPAGGR